MIPFRGKWRRQIQARWSQPGSEAQRPRLLPRPSSASFSSPMPPMQSWELHRACQHDRVERALLHMANRRAAYSALQARAAFESEQSTNLDLILQRLDEMEEVLAVILEEYAQPPDYEDVLEAMLGRIEDLEMALATLLEERGEKAENDDIIEGQLVSRPVLPRRSRHSR